MDSNRVLAYSVPLLIALVGLDFADSAPRTTAAADSLAPPPPPVASKPHPAKVAKRLTARTMDPRTALNAATVLRFGFVSLSTPTR